MATHDYVIANGTGAAVRSDLNNALAAIVSNNSGSSEPATTYAYQWWADTNTNTLKIRNSANNAWITLRELDGTMLIEDGSAASPGLAFADDTNTGIFSAANNQIGIATEGTERLEITSSEVVFNDPSNDVDFRVESNGETHMLFVDAGNDRVGIGDPTPSEKLNVAGNVMLEGGDQYLYLTNAGTGNSGIYIRGNTASTYLRSHSTGIFTWEVTGSEKMRLDSSGRLLVGTTSTSENSSLILEGFNGGTSDTDAILRLHRKTTTPADGSGLGNIAFGTPGTSGTKAAAWILGQRDGGTWTNGTSHPGRLVFSTSADGASSPTERMRIDSSGQVLVGTTLTSPHNSSGINVSPTNGVLIGVSGTHAIIAARHSTDGECIRLQKGSVDVGSIDVTGSGTTYTTTSDYRLKENVVDLDGAITRVKQLQPKRFNFIIDADTTVDGFLAHEAQTVVPEAVTGTHNEVDDDGNAVMQGIDQSKLVPLLTAALQEAIAKIETLETKVAALEAG